MSSVVRPTVVPSEPVTSARPSGHGLALASRGDALTPHLFAAIARRFPVIGSIEPELSPLQRYLVAAATFRPNRSRWVERFYKSALAARMRSTNAARGVAALPATPDAVVQVHALFSISDLPGVLYIDCTHAQSATLWPAWNPLRGRVLQEWYRREREAYAAARHLFAFSEATKASLVDDYGMDPHKITVTGAGVNFPRLPPPPVAVGIRDAATRDRQPPTILFIGNDFERKGGPVLLEAFRKVRAVVPHARLQLVGLDPGIVAQPGVDVLGSISDRERIAALYRNASVFTVPSIFDPYPLVALEAMAFALPVVTTNQMGTPEMIIDRVTGRLVEPGNAHALAEALLEVLSHPESAGRMGLAARYDVEKRFTWDAVVDRMTPALAELSPPVTQ